MPLSQWIHQLGGGGGMGTEVETAARCRQGRMRFITSESSTSSFLSKFEMKNKKII